MVNLLSKTVKSERSCRPFIISNLHLSRKLILIFFLKHALYSNTLYIHITTSGSFPEQQLVTEQHHRSNWRLYAMLKGTLSIITHLTFRLHRQVNQTINTNWVGIIVSKEKFKCNNDPLGKKRNRCESLCPLLFTDMLTPHSYDSVLQSKNSQLHFHSDTSKAFLFRLLFIKLRIMKLQRLGLERLFEALRLNLIYSMSWSLFALLLMHRRKLLKFNVCYIRMQMNELISPFLAVLCENLFKSTDVVVSEITFAS